MVNKNFFFLIFLIFYLYFFFKFFLIGVGKSTIMNLMLKELKPLDGQVVANTHLRLAHFSQHHVDQLDMEKTPVEHLQNIDGDQSISEVRRHLGKKKFIIFYFYFFLFFLFFFVFFFIFFSFFFHFFHFFIFIYFTGSFGIVGNLALQKIQSLSGGQKSRVTFSGAALKHPHIMLLDEPSNHLGNIFNFFLKSFFFLNIFFFFFRSFCY